MSLTLGIDFGTTACRAVVLDKQGQCLAMARTSLPAPLKTELGVEQDPQLWWQACQQTLTELFNEVDASKVLALAIDGTSSTLMLSALNGQPLGPALMYNDNRARVEANDLASQAPPEAAVHSPSSSLAKLLWLLTNDAPKQPFVALHQADWLMGHFCGRYDLSDENNALKMGYDPIARQWPDWMKSLELPVNCLPEVVPAGSPVGQISTNIATEFGLPAKCQVIAGTTDSTAAFLA